MISSLYLWDRQREKYIDEIKFFVKIYSEKIAPAFENIEEESQQIAQDHWDQIMSRPMSEEQAANFDPTDYLDIAIDLSVDQYLSHALMRYNTIAMWHSTLYQFWEQRVRLFLYESTRPRLNSSIEFGDFCTNFDKIKKYLSSFNINISSTLFWSKVEEINLLNNVIKHGDGSSSKKLKTMNMNLFNYDEPLEVSLLEQSLNLDEKKLNDYGDALVCFWEWFPEESFK